MKNTIKTRTLVITLAVCLVPLIVGLVFYAKLPDTMAVHFDINNTPDGYAPKLAAVVGLPIGLIALQAFMCIFLDIHGKAKYGNEKIVAVVKWIIPAVSVVVSTAVIVNNLGYVVDIPRICIFIIGVIFLAVGNYLPKSKPNSVIGVRTPATMKDENVWRKTNRLCGIISVIGGIAFLLSIFATYVVMAVVLCAFLAVMLLTTLIYPHVISKRK